MTDEIDLATELVERHLEESLKNILLSEKKKLEPKKRCYFCGEKFSRKNKYYNKKLFCDSDCADRFEKRPDLARG